MIKREPLFEADLGDNGGLLRLWNEEEVERFIDDEQAFWQSINGGNMDQPFATVNQRVAHLAKRLRQATTDGNKEAGSEWLRDIYADPNTRIPLSKSSIAQGIRHVLDTFGRDAARGALAVALPLGVWSEGISHASRPFWRGMIEQVVYESGLSPQAIEAAKSTLDTMNARASQVFASIESIGHEQLEALAIDYESTLEKQSGRAGELERKWVTAFQTYSTQASDTVARLEATHHAYLEQMRLKAPVEYWRAKAAEHRKSATMLRNWLVGFFVTMIGGYVIAFALGHGQIAAFLLQFQGSTGALLVVSAIFALLASLPLWIGRLLVRFYLSEHHLATDAKEREIMTQTYLALAADGVVDEKDRTLILGALFRSTPDGVVKDNPQPDTSPAAMLSRLLDSR